MGKTVFDTSLELDLLQEYFLVALDIFREFHYDKANNKCDTSYDRCSGWLSFLVTETSEDVERVIERYPWLQPVYEDASKLRNRPEEVRAMYSEALQIMDRNAMKYMIEELEEEIKILEEKKKSIEAEKNSIEAENTEQAELILNQANEISRLKELLKSNKIEY